MKTKKYKKSPRRRGYRKRKFKRSSFRNKIITLKLPFNGHKIIPDEIWLMMPVVTEFHSVGAYGTGGAMAYFNVCGNDILYPFQNPAVGPTFVQYTAAVGGAGGSFAGVPNSAYPAVSAAYPNYYQSLMALYQNWIVSSSSIRVQVILGAVSDEADLIICPVSDSNDNAAYALQEARYSKTCQIAYYQGGLKKENTLSSKMSTRLMYGTKVSFETLKTDITNAGALAAHPQAYRWNWQVGLANKFGNAAAGSTSIKVTVWYKVNLFNPKKINV